MRLHLHWQRLSSERRHLDLAHYPLAAQVNIGSLKGGSVARIARIALILRMTAGPSNWPETLDKDTQINVASLDSDFRLQVLLASRHVWTSEL